MSRRTVNEWFVDANFRYCVAFVKNGDERMRAVRLVMDVTGVPLREAMRFVDGLKDRIPLAAELDPPKAECPMCRQRIEIERIKDDVCPVCGERMFYAQVPSAASLATKGGG